MKIFNGLTTVNIELTSRCNKNCWMCGRRKVDRDYPNIKLNYGDMQFDIVKKISEQLPDNIVVQFHMNGEPLLYPRFGDAIKLFKPQIKCIDTNGKLLLDKSDDIINNLDIITISVIENDEDVNDQYRIVKEFLKIKGNKKPRVVYRCLGNVDVDRWQELDGLIVKRVLHDPMGSFKYEREPTIPEIGVCLEILNHLSINKDGIISCCVRFDPDGLGIIGNINDNSLIDIWNGKLRKQWIEHHINGERYKIPFCKKCHYWGVPRG